ncbi:MAG: hypothetical protein EOO50_14850 [Flavobacterium sp.]|uniref:DUF6265 family protein n=1 Tax=Flavobacterium sp. TaxID=239 RepID=UPI00121C5C4C|nr:DUF6265 family protein [Flavobacterium sp.]RZJ65187.1 MAG: hypothetical protein EOO50_14850 [Flavobacterium sp.]
MKNAIIALAAVAIVSCDKKKDETTSNENLKTETVRQSLEGANWLVGSWQDVSDEGMLTETWKTETDSSLAGKTIFLVGKDTAFTENIKLVSRNGSLVYITAVSDQNDGKAIEFPLKSATEKQLVFETGSRLSDENHV